MVTIPPTEKSVMGTLENVSLPQTNPSTGSRRRGPLRSRTVDTLLRILSVCHAYSSNVNLDSDKDGTNLGSVTKGDVPLADTGTMPNDSVCQEEMSGDETRRILSSQEGGLYSKHVESTGCFDNTSGERKDLSCNVDTNPSNSFSIEDQDNYDSVFEDQDSFPMIPISLADMMVSSPHLPIDKDVEEGEISGEFMDFMLDDDMASMDKTGLEPQDVIGIEPGHLIDNNLISSATDTVDDVGKDTVSVVSKSRRNLVDYSEIAINGIQAVNPERLHGRLENAEETAGIESGCTPLCPEHVPPLQSSLQNSASKNQDCVSSVKDNRAQNNRKRQGSCTGEERTNKKGKKSIDATTCSENQTMLGEHPEDASLEVTDASANKDDADEKKKKRVLTKERKAKKKRKDRIKRAEKNRKLGVKRLKLQPVIKEKKVTYCRHYLKGRCHEGEKCKFSHDTIPLTKSKPCCHFARHSCMKGDDCPFDHELSKYPCNNYISKGFCSRGSDCMFSHEAQPSEAALNALNEPKTERKPSSLLDNSGSKKQNKVDVSSREKIEKKSCSIPISVTTNTERNLVESTPKLSIQPPKGISFLSQEKPPLESRTSLKVVADVVQDSKEITKTPLVVPRGINFLSFGKKPGLDHSDGGFSFKMVKGIGKSPLSIMEGESSKSDSTVKVNDGVKVDAKIGNNHNRQMNSQRPTLMLPFMSNSSQRALHSALDFASDFVPGVKGRGPKI